MFTEERARWLFQHYRWLEQQLPRHEGRERTPLIQPTPAFYPQRNTRDHAFAESVFDTTRGFMGMGDWACVLAPHSDDAPRPAESVRGFGATETTWSGAAGTFSSGAGVVRITYTPSLLNEPAGLVATLAHELCHYLMAAVREEPPCGWAEHEPLTDLAAVHEGFGIFLCNTAFHFSQWTNSTHTGWRTGTRGYLNATELGFALAIFCVRNAVDPELALKYLKPNPAEVLWDAIPFVEELVAAEHS